MACHPQKNLRVAAMVNEYGLVDHDGGVVQRDGLASSVDKLAGGCVCCEEPLGSALEAKIGELLARPDHANDRYFSKGTSVDARGGAWGLSSQVLWR